MTEKRKLTAQENNRLLVQMQVLKVKLVEFSMKFSFNDRFTLWGQEVDEHSLTREKLKLAELYRVKTIYETAAYRKLPYFPSNGTGVKKVKEHY